MKEGSQSYTRTYTFPDLYNTRRLGPSLQQIIEMSVPAQNVVRYHRGLFVASDCLSLEEIASLMSVFKQETFRSRVGDNNQRDRGFSLHPDYLELSTNNEIGRFANGILKRIIEGNRWNEIFQVDLTEEPIDLFILKYEPSPFLSMDVHYDVCDPNRSFLSVALTIKSVDCAGGCISISNRNDGSFTNYSRDNFNYLPMHNSAYGFNGNYVAHHVRPIQSGERFVVVGFYPTQQTKQEVMRLWCDDADFICCKCAKTFSACIYLSRHERKNCCKDTWIEKVASDSVLD